MTTRPGPRLRHILLASVALCASAPTFAQTAMQATAAPIAGSTTAPATIAIAGGFRDEVRVNNATAIINWTPTDTAAGAAAINLLPSTNELRFISALGTYTVLNRVIPTGAASGRTVAFNGLVESFVNVPIGVAPQQRGGNVWFYSPNGILVGGTGRFNVGSLVLTTLDHPFNAVTGALTFGFGGNFQFGAGLNPIVAGSSVIVSPGATISANNGPGSYVALVSPRVEQRGSILVNGSAALVAGERVDLSVGVNNLFSINVITGSSDANGIVHTGSTVGTARSANNPDGRIYMTAVAKNQAITMLVGGTSGYQPATSAAIVNGAVVLTSGYNVSQGAPGFAPSAGGTGAANISFSNGGAGNIVVTSNLTGRASGNVTTAISAGSQFTVRNTETTNNTVVPINAALTWDGTTAAGTNNLDLAGVAMTVSGNLSLRSGAAGAQGSNASVIVQPSGASAGSLAIGGTFSVASGGSGTNPGAASVTVADGTLTVGGATTIDASSTGLFASASGGSASLIVNGGTATFNGDLSVIADGTGQGGGGVAANGTGGIARVSLGAGATPTTVTVLGTGRVSAQGISQTLQPPDPNVGGNGIGGSALIGVAAGTLTTQDMTVDASAFGGDGVQTGGIARGGSGQVAITGGRYDVRTLNVLSRETQAGAGTGGTAGSTAGVGLAAVDVSGGVLSVGAAGGDSLTISADALRAGQGLNAPTGSGALIAGTARLTATGTGSITTDATPVANKPPVLVTASTRYALTGSSVVGATQRGGTVTVNADGGTMSLHGLVARANTEIGNSNAAGTPPAPSFGGTVTVAARNGGALTVRAGARGTQFSALGVGGTNGVPAPGTGGTVNVLALGGTLALPDGFAASVIGYNGTGVAAGGTGGTINVQSSAGAAAQPGSLTAGVVTLDASGQVNAGSPNGTAGSIVVTNTGQTVTFANLFARAGVSGSGAPSGSITLTADNAPIVTTANTTGIDLGTLGTLTLNAVGAAGSIVGSTGVFGYGNDIFVGHGGVAPAPGSASTVTGPTVSLEAGRDQIHTGSVALRGSTVTLVGRRTLGGVDSAVFSTGDIELGSGLNASSNGITFRILDAAGRLRGYQGVSSYTNEITTPSSFVVSERAFAGTGDIDIRAGTGIDIADAGTSATGQVLLSSTTGDVRLGTSGVALATRPNAIVLTATAGTARFSNLFSRGAITASGLAVAGGDANAATNLLLNATNGATAFGTVVAGGALAAAAGTTITGTSATATTGTLSLVGPAGITVPTVVAGGAIGLVATNGAVTVATNLQPGGAATATGRSIFLRSLGALSFSSLNATAGNLDVSTVGALSITTPQATGSVTLASTGGNVAFGTTTAGTTLTVNAAGTATATSATAGGAVAITGATGITVPTVVSGGTTTLSAVNGAISIATNLQSAGPVTASGRSILLRATGSLVADTLTATAGGIDLTTGGMAQVTGATTATGALTVNAGQTNFGSITAGSVAITSGQGVIFTTMNSGGAVTLNAGDDALGTSIAAGGNLAVNAARNFNVGNVQAGGTVAISGANELTATTLISGGTTALNAANGAINIGDLRSPGLVSATARALIIGSGGGLSFQTLNATAGSAIVTTTGNLTTGAVTATEDVRLAGGAGFTLQTGAITAGDEINVGATSTFTGNLTTTGTGPDAEGDGRAIEVTGNQIGVGVVDSAGSVLLNGGGPLSYVLARAGTSAAIRSIGPITGGNVVAGTTLEVLSGGSIDVGNLQAAGAVNVSNLAFGPGATGTMRTGNVSGSTVLVTSTLGTTTTGNVTGTGDVQINGAFGVTLGSAISTGGGVEINVQTAGPITSGALRAAGNIGVSAQVGAGAVTLTTLDAGGRILMRSGDGTLRFDRATAGDLVGFSATGNIDFGAVVAGGTFQAQTPGTLTGTSAISASGAPNILQGGTGISLQTLATNGVTLLTATNGPISINDLRVNGTVSATGRSVLLRGPGALTFTALQGTAGNVDVTTAGTLNAGATSATGTLSLTSSNGALSFTTAQAGGNATLTASTTVTGTSLTSGGAISVAANSGITIPTVVATGAVNVAALNGAIRVGTNIAGSTVSANGNGIFLRATGALNTGRLSSTADIDVQSVGNLTTDFTEARGNVTFASTTGSVGVNALGVPPADLIPVNATINAATTATLNNVQVSNALAVTSAGATTVNGSAVARTIAIGSGDIVIAGQARLGALGTTTQLTLTNNSTQNRTTIGGTGTGGYSLSAAELNRIFANNIAIVAPVIGTASTAFNSTRTPDVVVEGFTLDGGTNLNPNGTFSITSGGKVRVTGAVAFTGLGDATVAMRGDEAVEILDAGSIVLGGANGLAGTLDLTSRNIVAASTTAYADFAAASTLSAISDRAGRNDGAVNEGGYLQANAIRATLLNSTLIIQNTGTSAVAGNRDFASRRGFTVGAGGFTIVQGGTNPARIAINGRQVGATTPLGVPTVGGFVTGLDLIPLIKIVPSNQQAGGTFQIAPSGIATAAQLAIAPSIFDTTSTVNGCAITGANGCRIVPNDPIRDILRSDFGEGSVGNLLPLALIQLRDAENPGDEPLIDEPVTGAGNDDLWSVDDAKPKCDPEKEKCPAPR